MKTASNSSQSLFSCLESLYFPSRQCLLQQNCARGLCRQKPCGRWMVDFLCDVAGVFFFKENISKETVMVILATNPFANRRRVSFFKGNVSKETIMVISVTNPFTNRQTVSFFKGNVSKENVMVILTTNPFANHQTVSFFKGNVSMENVMIILATFPLHHVNLRTAAKEDISQHLSYLSP